MSFFIFTDTKLVHTLISLNVFTFFSCHVLWIVENVFFFFFAGGEGDVYEERDCILKVMFLLFKTTPKD